MENEKVTVSRDLLVIARQGLSILQLKLQEDIASIDSLLRGNFEDHLQQVLGKPKERLWPSRAGWRKKRKDKVDSEKSARAKELWTPERRAAQSEQMKLIRAKLRAGQIKGEKRRRANAKRKA